MDSVRKTNKPILLCGGTGQGKSSSIGEIRDKKTKQIKSYGLPPEETIILNAELQDLPVANADDFNNTLLNDFNETTTAVDFILQVESTPEEELQDKLDVEVQGITIRQVLQSNFIIFESLTAISEQMEEKAKAKYGKSWDTWNEYNSLLSAFLKKIKQIKRQVIVLGIPEKNPNDPDFKQYFRVKGNDRRFGGIEKEFQIVLFTKLKYNDEGKVTDIELEFEANRFNTAKAPMGVFDDNMPNDLFIVANSIRSFYGGELYIDNRRA